MDELMRRDQERVVLMHWKEEREHYLQFYWDALRELKQPTHGAVIWSGCGARICSMYDKLTAAVARYQAMAGQLKDLPAAAARRARSDQRRHAEAYLPKRGKRLAEPMFMIRFLVEICGLSLREASQAVRAEMLKDEKQSWEPQGEPCAGRLTGG